MSILDFVFPDEASVAVAAFHLMTPVMFEAECDGRTLYVIGFTKEPGEPTIADAVANLGWYGLEFVPKGSP